MTEQQIKEIMALVDDYLAAHEFCDPRSADKRAAIESRLRDVAAPPVPEPVIAWMDTPIEKHFRARIDVYADKHQTLLVRQLATLLREAWKAPTEATTPQPASEPVADEMSLGTKGVLLAIKNAGLTLVKTQHGYQLLNIGKAVAQ